MAQKPTEINDSPINATPSVYISITDPEEPEMQRLEPVIPAVRELERLKESKPNRLRTTAPALGRRRDGRWPENQQQRPELNRPRTGSVLQQLFAAVAYPAASADKIFDVLANSVNDTRRHRMRVTIAGED